MKPLVLYCLIVQVGHFETGLWDGLAAGDKAYLTEDLSWHKANDATMVLIEHRYQRCAPRRNKEEAYEAPRHGPLNLELKKHEALWALEGLIHKTCSTSFCPVQFALMLYCHYQHALMIEIHVAGLTEEPNEVFA